VGKARSRARKRASARAREGKEREREHARQQERGRERERQREKDREREHRERERQREKEREKYMRGRKRGRGERSVKDERREKRRNGSEGEKGNERRTGREKKGSDGNVRERDKFGNGAMKRSHIQKGGLGITIASLGTMNTNVVAEIMNHGLTVQNTSRPERVKQIAGPQATIKVAKENQGLTRRLAQGCTKILVLMMITDTVGSMMNTTITGRPDIQPKCRHVITQPTPT
jgi:hypothetical protein